MCSKRLLWFMVDASDVSNVLKPLFFRARRVKICLVVQLASPSNGIDRCGEFWFVLQGNLLSLNLIG